MPEEVTMLAAREAQPCSLIVRTLICVRRLCQCILGVAKHLCWGAMGYDPKYGHTRNDEPEIRCQMATGR